MNEFNDTRVGQTSLRCRIETRNKIKLQPYLRCVSLPTASCRLRLPHLHPRPRPFTATTWPLSTASTTIFQIVYDSTQKPTASTSLWLSAVSDYTCRIQLPLIESELPRGYTLSSTSTRTCSSGTLTQQDNDTARDTPLAERSQPWQITPSFASQRYRLSIVRAPLEAHWLRLIPYFLLFPNNRRSATSRSALTCVCLSFSAW